MIEKKLENHRVIKVKKEIKIVGQKKTKSY